MPEVFVLVIWVATNSPAAMLPQVYGPFGSRAECTAFAAKKIQATKADPVLSAYIKDKLLRFYCTRPTKPHA